jgi:hypothetical protein
MTEEEWLGGSDAMKSLVFLRRRLDPRTLRHPFGLFRDYRLRRRVRLFAGQVAFLSYMRRGQHPEVPEWDSEWFYIQDDIERWSEDRLRHEHLVGESYIFIGGFEGLISRSLEVWRSPWTEAARALGFLGKRADSCTGSEACSLLSDIFGNPFRPVVFSKIWRTDSAVSLAQKMYESYDFSLMPLLADLLQDAGCDNPQILEHCRGPGPHVRGCFVVDACLGKS